MNTPVTGHHVLIVEDEAKLARLLADYLSDAGYQSTCLDNGRDVIPWVKAHAPDLILLDLMLPGMNGIDICRALRGTSQVPIIMVTARVEEVDRLLGLELGADDYICKPFSPREVVARVRSVLRRALPPDTPASPGLLTLDRDSHRVRTREREVELTSVEFQLFDALYREPGRIFSRSRLIDRIYDDRRIVSERTVDSHIKKLRKKLAGLLPDQELIHSVYGAGYRYEPREKDGV
jgi:two-component system, OmpR family, response regulator BaeR